MSASTNLYLPLHVRNDDLLMVLAKIMGETYRLATYDDQKVVSYRPFRTEKVPRPFDPTLPCSEENPWHIEFDRSRQGLQMSLSSASDTQNFRLNFVDLAKNPYAWNYFTNYDQTDSDGLFLRRAHLLSPSSTNIAVAACVRLARFFGGEVFFDDNKSKDKPDLSVSAKQAIFPAPKRGSTSNERWFAFFNALNEQSLLTESELVFGSQHCAYTTSGPQASFLGAVKAYEFQIRLHQRLAPVEEEPVRARNKSRI